MFFRFLTFQYLHLRPSIVLIHGFGASSDHWRNNAEIFASEGFRVFGIDLIGFGKSEQKLKSKIKHLENQFWANQLASFLDEIVDIQKNGKVILIIQVINALNTLSRFFLISYNSV